MRSFPTLSIGPSDRVLFCCAFLFLSVCSLPRPSRAADESPFQFSGSLKTYFTNVGGTVWMGDTSGFVWDTPLRARLFYKPADGVGFEAVEEITSRYQSGAGFVASLLGATPSSPYRVKDFDRFIAGSNEGDGTKLLQNLDRLSTSLHFGRLDVTVGRQAISFGSARAVNPTDVFMAIEIQNPDHENRSGIDAVRTRYAWSDLGELDAGWVVGKDARWEDSAVFLKPRIHLLGLDVAPMGVVYRKNLLAGLDLQGSIAGAGTWFEGAFVHPYPSEKPYVKVSTGFDYNFGENLYAFLEYHYNGAGEGNPADYGHPAHLQDYRDGTDFLLGRQYLIPSLTYQATPLMSVQSKILTNLADPSILVMLLWDYNIAKNLYLDVGAAVPIGSGLVKHAPSSEYGLYPSFQYIYSRFYF